MLDPAIVVDPTTDPMPSMPPATKYTFNRQTLSYPLARDLEGYELVPVASEICNQLKNAAQHFEFRGFDLVFTGTSGMALATAISCVSSTANAPLLAYTQVSKKEDHNHREKVESSRFRTEKDDMGFVFLDDMVASGVTYEETEEVLQRHAGNNRYCIPERFNSFDGLVQVTCSGLPERIEDALSFTIQPE